MKYYELNSKGNELSKQRLQCPICGNCALGYQEAKIIARIVVEDGKLKFSFQSQRELSYDPDNDLKCPQCTVPLIAHELVKEVHKDCEDCPGCIICGNIDENIFEICKECVLGYQDTIIGCETCPYNYSRIQRGIDVVELKRHFGVEYAQAEEESRQLTLFKEANRKFYKRRWIPGSNSWYEQVIDERTLV